MKEDLDDFRKQSCNTTEENCEVRTHMVSYFI